MCFKAHSAARPNRYPVNARLKLPENQRFEIVGSCYGSCDATFWLLQDGDMPMLAYYFGTSGP
jgi:hypothetical protein